MICLKIRTFVVSATTESIRYFTFDMLWFAWKFVPLWYQQQLIFVLIIPQKCCDLLENSYLCGISNNLHKHFSPIPIVVICLKIRTFVVSATTPVYEVRSWYVLWFAWKFVPLWYQQQHQSEATRRINRCDLLENSYLCGISNNYLRTDQIQEHVVICLKIRTFVVSATTEESDQY